jgi:hypothetical protein
MPGASHAYRPQKDLLMTQQTDSACKRGMSREIPREGIVTAYRYEAGRQNIDRTSSRVPRLPVVSEQDIADFPVEIRWNQPNTKVMHHDL